jgi:hypothetical protein
MAAAEVEALSVAWTEASAGDYLHSSEISVPAGLESSQELEGLGFEGAQNFLPRQN